MSSYQKNGNVWKPHRDGALNLQPKLDPGNYKLGVDQFGNLYLEKIDDFTVPDEVFGDLPKLSERIITTFRQRPLSTGVLLSGEKGSGKTLLAKKVCVDLGVPVIVINAAFVGDAFNSFIQSIAEPAVIFFDEFEKVYSPQDQEKLLTLLDGVYPSKKLFLLTSNNSFRIDDHMRNRPGRIYYYLQFSGLQESFVREFCEAKLDNAENVERVVDLYRLFSQFNFDMLKSVVEELNRFPDLSPREAVKLLNVKPESDAGGRYAAKLWLDGVEVELGRGDRLHHGNPLAINHYSYDYKEPARRPAVADADELFDDEGTWKSVSIGAEHFANYDPTLGVYTFVKDSFVLTMTLLPTHARGAFLPF